MNFKKIAIATILASATFSVASMAADGTLNFTGKITSSACNIDASSTASGDIALGTVASNAFSSVGTTAAPTRFTIVLTGCPADLKTASVRFDGTPSSNSEILALTTGADAATGVGIGLFEADSSTKIPLQTKSKSQTLTTDSNTLTYIAKYVSTAEKVSAGDANATATYTIAYN